MYGDHVNRLTCSSGQVLKYVQYHFSVKFPMSLLTSQWKTTDSRNSGTFVWGILDHVARSDPLNNIHPGCVPFIVYDNNEVAWPFLGQNEEVNGLTLMRLQCTCTL